MDTPFFDLVAPHAIARDQADVHIPFSVQSGVAHSVLCAVINSPQFSDPDTVSWNGTPLTKLNTGLNQNFFCSVFYILNPEPGDFDFHLHWPSAEREAIVTIMLLGQTTTPVYIPKTDNSDDNGTAPNLFFIGQATSPDYLAVGFVMSQETTHVSSTGEQHISNIPSISVTFRQSVWAHSHNGSQGQDTMGVRFGTTVNYQFKFILFPLMSDVSSVSPSASLSPSSSPSASVSSSVSQSPSSSASPSPVIINKSSFLVMF